MAERWSSTLERALAAARAASPTPFAPAITHGTLLAGIYAPIGSDPQTPHERDEVYFVVSGSGQFVRGDEREAFGPGAALFVPARMPHRFEDFSEDLVVWVVFYGPQGGEA
jgi:mannose-6-phosphate isomerase-like protein (cupin superfamily)